MRCIGIWKPRNTDEASFSAPLTIILMFASFARTPPPLDTDDPVFGIRSVLLR
jgi:hypothetical protein